MAPPRKEGNAIARDAVNTVLGGSFTSRLNMKLREEKGWAYGARSSIGGGRGSQVFTATASVQADKTAESISEVAKMLTEVLTTKPIQAAELSAARDDMSLGLTGAWATSAGIANYLMDELVYRLPQGYYATYAEEVAGITLERVNEEAKVLFEGPVTWIVVGDRSKIEEDIRSLGLDEVRAVDADGNPLP